MAQYLISSFGFSPDRALRVAASPHFSPIKTSDRPESVVRFFKETGFTDSQIKGMISWYPPLLAYHASKTFKPRVQELMAAGFTGDTLIQLIQYTPVVLCSNSALSRIQFWRDYTGSDLSLLKILYRNHRLLQSDIDNAVKPNIKILRDYGFCDADVQKVLLSLGNFLKKPDFINNVLAETKALGFFPGSRMFVQAITVVGRKNGDTIKRKFEYLRNTYGWSHEEVHCAFNRYPTFVCLSERTLKSKMDFLLGNVGLTSKEVSSKPGLLGYSLEKRLVPRHDVLSILKLKGLHRRTSLYGVVTMSEKDFLEKFVRPYNKEIPELEEVYAAACQGKKLVV